MQELIDRLVKEAGVTPEQAKQSIETIAAFVKEKFPMLFHHWHSHLNQSM
jgi:polyhydroxyalkanoate synthesis regulator phasin